MLPLIRAVASKRHDKAPASSRFYLEFKKYFLLENILQKTIRRVSMRGGSRLKSLF